MKTIFIGLALGTALVTACNNDKKLEAENAGTTNSNDVTLEKAEVKQGEYINLITGEQVSIVKDTITGIAVDRETQLPVEFYYDPISLDTMYQSGMVVNNLLIREGEGKYQLDDAKIKIEGDEMKIKK